MNIDQINKLRAAKTTSACLHDDKNAPLWTGIKGIEEAVVKLDDNIETIDDRAQKQSERTGYAELKAGARDTMLQAAFTVCSGLKALASASGDQQLAAQVDFSRSDLARGREADIVNRCKSILTLGTANADALAEKYNVDATDLKALKNAIPAFTSVQPKPQQGRAASAAATSELVALFTSLDKVLNEQLDPLMEKFQGTNPAFYNEYQNARAIVDNSASHEAKTPVPAPAPLPKAA